MKTLFSILALAFTLTLGMMLVSCNSSPKIEKATDVNGSEYTSAYICPMYCKGSGSAQPGKCPACKMDYVANAKLKQPQNNHSGHSHGHDHSGHNHSHDHSSHNHNHDHSGQQQPKRHPHDHDGDGKPDH